MLTKRVCVCVCLGWSEEGDPKGLENSREGGNIPGHITFELPFNNTRERKTSHDVRAKLKITSQHGYTWLFRMPSPPIRTRERWSVPNGSVARSRRRQRHLRMLHYWKSKPFSNPVYGISVGTRLPFHIMSQSLRKGQIFRKYLEKRQSPAFFPTEHKIEEEVLLTLRSPHPPPPCPPCPPPFPSIKTKKTHPR